MQVEKLYQTEFTDSLYPDRIDQTRPKGTLVVIGGRAQTESLQSVSSNLPQRSELYISTLASNEHERQFLYYKDKFSELGVHVTDEKLFDTTQGIFFTGGKQDLLMQRLEASINSLKLKEFYNSGGVVAGTSAGASFMSEIMPIEDTYSKGFGFVPYIIDQHFTERNRLERLKNLVAKFPERIGIGIDENTAWVYKNSQMKVEGEGSVHLVIGHKIERAENSISIEHVVMRAGEEYDLSQFDVHKTTHEVKKRPGG